MQILLKKTFSKKNKLLSKEDFRMVFREAAESSCPFFRLLVRHNKLTFSRLGIVINKKCLTKAVQRNYVKRIIREIFRESHGELNNVDIVVMGKKGLSKIFLKKSKQYLELFRENLERELIKWQKA